jgi:hypothetical protein
MGTATAQTDTPTYQTGQHLATAVMGQETQGKATSPKTFGAKTKASPQPRNKAPAGRVRVTE